MNRAQDPDLSAAQMQLLWVGNNEKEFAYLRDVLTRSGEGRLGLDRVRSPEEALQRLNQTTYDLLLCDYKPGDGMALRLLHEIRKEGPRAPVIFLSDHVDQIAVDAAIKAGASDCLQTPNLNESSIARAIRYAIDVYCKERQRQKAEDTVRKLWRAVEQSADLVISEINEMLPRLIGEDIQLIFAPGKNVGKVKADPVQIEQIVMNLAANARDAMPNGGKLTIETADAHLDESYIQRHSIVPPGEYVLLAVTDTGEGIAPEHVAHIFEPFYTTKAEGKGTGLGLATVYGIDKQNGGFIWVYSEPGLGTAFKIYLPCAQYEPEQKRPLKLVEEMLPGTETLLLVEDEPAVRQSEREFLTLNGYSVLDARDGRDALSIAREYDGTIDMMITDVIMPHMSGAKLAEQLLLERPGMKVLFVSGYAETTVLRHGAIDVTTRFLQKPFSLKMLAKKIREVLDAPLPAALASLSTP